MFTRRRSALFLALCLGSTFGCQKSDQSAIQPEKLASSSPASTATPATASAMAQEPGTQQPGTQQPGTQQPGTQQPGAQPGGSDSSATPGPLLPYASGKAPAASPTPKAVADPKAPAAAAAPAGQAEVKLLKPGAEPRKELRIRSKVGHTEKMQMTMKMDISMSIGGQQAPSNALPAMIMTMDMKVTDTKPNGDIRYEFVMSDTDVAQAPGVQPEVVAAMKGALGKMKGLSGSAVVTNRGFNRDAKINLPPGVDPQTRQVMQGMEQAMQQIGAPLPAEPVGIGAQWKYATPMTQNGITLNQEAIYDLVKLDGDLVSCDVKVVQTAPAQKVASPVGVMVDLLSLQSQGSGKTAFRLDRLVPVQSDMSLLSSVAMGLPDNKKMQMSTKMTIAIAAK